MEMDNGSSGSGSQASSGSKALLLRVLWRNKQPEEYYVANGLRIGRSQANIIILEDDTAGREHAVVTIEQDGSAWLHTAGETDRIWVNGRDMTDLQLRPGARFRIGRTEFECMLGHRMTSTEATTAGCPYCGSPDVAPVLPDHATAAESHMHRAMCPDCHHSVLIIGTDRKSSSAIIIPEQFGQYCVAKFVGQGGMGVVLKGQDMADGRIVAIKVLLYHASASQSAIDRFRREAALMRQINHPNVVELLDSGEEGHVPFLVMEWAEGRTLRHILDDKRAGGGHVPFETAIRWLAQICQGLRAMHEAGIVHRDIKPSNILIHQSGRVCLADLGIAKRPEAAETGLTTTGSIPGTWEYMAPEQMHSPDSIDARADQYALGVAFYELLTGTRPLGAWRPPSSVNPTVPAEFDAFLARMLSTFPNDRFANLAELLESTAGLARFLVARWSYREKHGLFLNYLEVKNLSYYPLTNVCISVVLPHLVGEASVAEVKVDRLDPGQTRREKNVLSRGFLGGDVRRVEAVLTHSEGSAVLDAASQSREDSMRRRCSQEPSGHPWPPLFLGISTIILSLFEPIFLLWSAVLIPWNWRRLGCRERVWRTVWIIIPGVIVAYILVWLRNSFVALPELVLAMAQTIVILVTSVGVMYCEVSRQTSVYRQYCLQGGPQGSKLWPAATVLILMVWGYNRPGSMRNFVPAGMLVSLLVYAMYRLDSVRRAKEHVVWKIAHTCSDILGQFWDCVKQYPQKRMVASCPSCGKGIMSPEIASAQCKECRQPFLVFPAGPNCSSPVLIPSQFGAYRTLEVIVEDGAEIVLRGVQPQSGRRVMIRLRSIAVDAGPASSGGSESAPFVPADDLDNGAYLDKGKIGEFQFYITPWGGLRTLEEFIADFRKWGKLPEFADVIPWFLQVSEALAAIHATGKVYGSLKLSSVLIDSQDQARLMDPVLIRHAQGRTSALPPSSLHDMPDNLAPEQSDQVALGMMMHEVLTGLRPTDKHRRASKVNPTVPPEFDKVISRLLSSIPSHRFCDMWELISGAGGLKELAVPGWTYRWWAGDYDNYLEIENLSYFPLRLVTVHVVAHGGQGQRVEFQITTDRLDVDAVYRKNGVFPRNLVVAGVAHVEARMRYSEGRVGLSPKAKAREDATRSSLSKKSPEQPLSLWRQILSVAFLLLILLIYGTVLVVMKGWEGLVESILDLPPTGSW